MTTPPAKQLKTAPAPLARSRCCSGGGRLVSGPAGNPDLWAILAFAGGGCRATGPGVDRPAARLLCPQPGARVHPAWRSHGSDAVVAFPARSLPSRASAVAHQLLLRSAAALWVTNFLVFASWYWRLDAGGPHARHLRASHTRGDFLFPADDAGSGHADCRSIPDWSPGFVDYLFLAFNTSTAFSPTDSPVLSRWAKVLMMIQSSISLATLALLAARAVNIL